jgi:tetratricopeptide (TPR) repeat protein
LALDQNLAHAQAGVLATAKISIGRAEETEGHVQEGVRLSPRDSNIYIWAMLGGLAKLYLSEDEAAVAWLRRSIEANRNFPLPQFLLASALAHLDRQEAAHAAARAGLALDPAFTIRRCRSILTHMIDYAQTELILDGMHEAGVPEG